MFPLYRKDERTDRERYLEDELEHERDAARERDRREDEARKQRRKEQQEAWAYQDRQADSWPEAFQKQARLCWREHNQFPEDIDDHDYFKETAQANEKALEIWRAVAASKKAELDELQKKIEAVWDSVRNEVADQLAQEGDHFTYKSTAETIRDDQLSGYLDW
jgi:ABC-type taurine transport system substrate-binding protein